ncbi:hypothetical protein QQF64_019829 [Cirrhinus molitorella]|uniref:Ig-like domain-containing protein n=1 Tax=Cirrhinus molitorella TaxID=172907 RepID=A0ABR3LKN9_9TELE
MKVVIFFTYIPFVYSGFHTVMTTYTGIRGQNFLIIPEFSAVTTLDGQQIDYYDSITETLVPKQDWMKFVSEELWKEDTEIRKRMHQIYKKNIPILMERFNQTDGVHTYQRMYGCEWDDETEDSDGFDQYSYDGEDFIMLDMQNGRYIASIQQAVPTVKKWNNDQAHLEALQQYYEYECVYWLKFFLKSRKADLKRAPEVSLLQKDPSSPVVCHATGFYPSAVTITWVRNGQEHDEDVNLEETLPNVDGTFQKTSTLSIQPDEWKNNYYVCVVEHKGKTIRKILTESEIKNNDSKSQGSYGIMFVCLVITVFTVLVLYFAVQRIQKQLTVCENKKQDYSNKNL